MSYILDALRMSEEQRQHGAAPTLRAVQPTPVENAQPTLPMYGLVVAALVAAGALLGTWRPWQHEQVSLAEEPVASRPTEPRQRQPILAPLPALSGAAREPAQEPWTQPSPARAEAIMKQDVHLQTRRPIKADNVPPPSTDAIAKEAAAPDQTATAHVPEKTATPVQQKLSGAAPPGAPQDQQVISIGELPLTIRQEIPPMSISVHFYSSTPKDRIVGINDRLLQEGEYLAPGLKLEEIAPDGMVFRYKEYLFRRGL